MKARYGFNSQSRSAMKQEIRRQIVEQKEIFMDGIDAVILWFLHAELGHGKTRLERDYKRICEVYREMCRFYETDETFPAELKLKEMGIDVEKLRKEVLTDDA